MNEKQYEAFRQECARRDGFEELYVSPGLGLRGYKRDYTGQIDEAEGVPTYANHDSLQRIIDGLSDYEMDWFITYLHTSVFGIKPYKDASMNVVREYLKSTVEQKQAALCAVFGLEEK